MDLKQLEYFVRVAELGSFTRAAIALDIAQPALSRQVRLLEVELRQNLLVRNGRGALPTEAGQLLLAHARGILHQVARAREALAQARGAFDGRVAIGLPPSVARALTVPLGRAFRQQMPQATLSISEGLSVALQDSLGNGRLDIAVLYNAQASAEMECSPLVNEELVLIQARRTVQDQSQLSGPVSLQTLATLPLLIPSQPNAIRMHVESELAAAGLRPTIALEIDGVSAILELVADGAGCAVLSRHAVVGSPHASAFAVQQIGLSPFRIGLFLATSSRRPSTLTQKAALQLLRELAGRHL
ncbi:MAG: LysR substrate-binding domain-containing protein [Pseudomonadota bacterium]